MSGRTTLLAVMCVGYFLVLLDVTIVNVALPSIDSGLHAGTDGLQWVVDGYAVALASLMLGGGSIGDLHGHKRVVLAGLAVFGAGSLACGVAPGIGALVAGRVLQGVGAAALLPGTLAIITRAFPGRGEQARAIGIWAGVGSVALPAGPLLGGALVEALGWRAVFLVNLPIVAVAFPVAARVVQEAVEPQARSLDTAGIALGAVLLATVTFAFVQSGRDGLSVAVVAAAAVALLALVAFLAVERSRGDEAMLPLSLFRSRGFSIANAVAGTMNLGTLGLLFVLTLYLQRVLGHSALSAGLLLIPLFAPLSVLAPFAGRLTSRTGPRAPMVAGLLLAAAGVALLGRLDASSGVAELLPALLLWGVGLGFLTPAVVAAAMSAVPAPRAGLASAINNTARQAGGAIGIAALGALAGETARRSHFLSGFHLAGYLVAGLFGAAALATLALPSQA
jgi:MFS transporter, DHA2 family, methylenomycin A resistance protein